MEFGLVRSEILTIGVFGGKCKERTHRKVQLSLRSHHSNKWYVMGRLFQLLTVMLCWLLALSTLSKGAPGRGTINFSSQSSGYMFFILNPSTSGHNIVPEVKDLNEPIQRLIHYIFKKQRNK